jgi:predicted acyl esterase
MLHLTRYGRNTKVKWPFSLVMGLNMNLRTMKFVDAFVTQPAWTNMNRHNGTAAAAGTAAQEYAWVTVDVRGTGTSFGRREVDLSVREVTDYQ